MPALIYLVQICLIKVYIFNFSFFKLRDVEEIEMKDAVEKEDDKDEEEIEVKKPRMEGKIPSARVVGIVKRNWRQYCGMILPSAIKGSLRVILLLSLPKISLPKNAISIIFIKSLLYFFPPFPSILVRSNFQFEHHVKHFFCFLK